MSDYLDDVNDMDVDTGGDSWKDHREFRKLGFKDFDEFDDFISWLKSYLVYRKTTAMNPRHKNDYCAVTASFAKRNFDRNNDESVSLSHVQNCLKRLSNRAFILKKDIDKNLKDFYSVAETTQYVYEYQTLKERAKEKKRKRDLREKMRESSGDFR